jgi:glycosyltransferase involved in cell wall biosynthesis
MTEELGVAAETLFLIPAFNAARTLGPVLDGLLGECERHGLHQKARVLVVDDGSTDETSEVARRRGVLVERHTENRGKGAALRLGLGWALAHEIPKVVSLDADGQHPPSEAIKLCLHTAKNDALLVGTRDLRAAGAPRPNQLSNAFSNRVLSLFAGQRLEDTQSGLRRYPTSATLALNCKAEGFAYEADVLLRAARRGMQIVHVPTSVLYPPARTSHFRAISDPARIVLSVVTTALTTPTRKPSRARGVSLSAAPLLIFLNAQGYAPELDVALLNACSEAASPRVCDPTQSLALAAVEVTWHDELSSASVKFLDRGTGRAAETRTISFMSEDPELERFRAVGFAIGTWGTSGESRYVAEPFPTKEPGTGAPTETPEKPAANSPPTATSTPPLPPEAPEKQKLEAQDAKPQRAGQDPAPSRQAQARTRWLLDGGVDLGTSYSSLPRIGPSLGLVGQNLFGPLDLVFRGAFHFVPSWTTDEATFFGHFWSFGTALGITGRMGPWAVSGELGAFVEETTLGGLSLTNNSRTLGGGKGSLLLRRELIPRLHALAALDVGLRSGTTTVEVDGQPTLTLSPLFATLRVGVSLELGAPR